MGVQGRGWRGFHREQEGSIAVRRGTHSSTGEKRAAWSGMKRPSRPVIAATPDSVCSVGNAAASATSNCAAQSARTIMFVEVGLNSIPTRTAVVGGAAAAAAAEPPPQTAAAALRDTVRYAGKTSGRRD